MHTCHTGAVSELVASAWLLKLGYEVFRNVSGGGPGDLAIWNPLNDERHIIDVKTWSGANRSIKPSVPKSRSHPNATVLFLLVRAGEVQGFYKDGVRYWPLLVDEPNYGPF